jgi:hypothetical protein
MRPEINYPGFSSLNPAFVGTKGRWNVMLVYSTVLDAAVRSSFVVTVIAATFIVAQLVR